MSLYGYTDPNVTQPRDRLNDNLRKENLRQLNIERQLKAVQNLPNKNKLGISIGTQLLISACIISVLSYKFAKGNKEFKAFIGLLSPYILFYGVSKYKKYNQKQNDILKDPEPNHPFGSA